MAQSWTDGMSFLSICKECLKPTYSYQSTPSRRLQLWQQTAHDDASMPTPGGGTHNVDRA